MVEREIETTEMQIVPKTRTIKKTIMKPHKFKTFETVMVSKEITEKKIVEKTESRTVKKFVTER